MKRCSYCGKGVNQVYTLDEKRKIHLCWKCYSAHLGVGNRKKRTRN